VSRLGLKHASRRLGAAVLFVFLPMELVVAWGISLAGRGPGRSDFWTFWLASRTVLHGGNPYPAIASLPHVADKWFAPFVYPPVAAFLLAPLAVLPYAVATVLYYAANIAAVALALRLLGVRDRRCYGLVFVAPPTLQAAGIGTISIPLLVLVAAAWRYRDRTARIGLLVGCAVTAKLFLWPLWFWLVGTRRWRAAAIAVATSLVAVIVAWAAIGWQGLREYPTLVARMTGLEGPHGYSLYALERVFGAGNGTAARIVSVVGVVAVAAVLRAWRDDQALLVALIAVSFLATPILWPHYLVLLFVPVALASPRLSWLWFAPVALWADAMAWSHGNVLRIVGELALSAAVVGVAVHRSLPPGQRAAVGTTRLRSSECLQPTGATSSVL
jgi:alpha-1,2-mannosyltransferase